ncbi:hypothetical protein JTB14_023481 [Gonioctena quinquepunctata]|nr:hypothetical protein JTB14_023481 [Gonioctena quinquepunctata]
MTVSPSSVPVNFFNNHLGHMQENLSTIKLISEVSENPLHTDLYKCYKREYASALNEAKNKARNEAYDNISKNSENKNRDAWKLINFERNKKKGSNSSVCEISANEFVEYFATAAKFLTENLNNNELTIDPIKKLPNKAGSFFLFPVTEVEVLDAIRSLKNTNCFDVYDLNSKIIKYIKEIIAQPLSQLL